MKLRIALALGILSGIAAARGGGVNTALESHLGTPITSDAYTSGGVTVGWSFTIGSSSLTLTHLGMFDEDADGFANAHQVGLWSSTGTLLASTTVASSTTSDMYSDSFRFESVAPLTLNAGQTYVLGAYYGPGDADRFLTLGAGNTFSSAISYLHSRQNLGGGGFAFPQFDAGTDEGNFGPNFVYLIPEPAAAALLVLGTVLLKLGTRRNGSSV